MQNIRLIPIAGVQRGRPSLFGSSVVQGTGFHPTLARGPWLAQTPEEWYRRAKESIAKFDELLDRVSKIAAKVEREKLLAWIGTASTEDTPAYRYATVKSDLQQDVEAYTPPAINAYQVSRRTNRIEKLEGMNRELETMVTNAEQVYGKLPEATVIERERIVRLPAEGAAAPAKTDWTLPLVIGGGAIAVAAIVTLVFGGKK